ncbi:MAG: starch phosphorylase, partial [Gammaproteobacteria bacterium]
RIHEYKRQLLNVLHVIDVYARAKAGQTQDLTPRSILIAGKAAPGYAMAKNIIKLVNNVANVVNRDTDVNEWLQVAFLPNYRVTSMEAITPAVDLSVQISTAGKEASGTGNMKLMMNGAVTIGTLDGANIEILEAVGEENFFAFGLNTDDVAAVREHYNPQAIVDACPRLAQVMDLLSSGHFCQFEPGVFDPVVNAIMDPYDAWLTAADFAAFIAAEQRAGDAYADREQWVRMSINNTATSGRFSSDRTIQDYNNDIWHLEPINLSAPRRAAKTAQTS